MYKVKLATLAYKIFHDGTPRSMGHILTKKTSSIHHLRTTNTVTVPRFNTYFMNNSIAFRASIVWNLLTPDLAKTFNVKNYTRMAFKSDKLRNLDFQAESPQTIPHNNDNDFNIFNNILIYSHSLGLSLNTDPISGNALIAIVLK